MNIKEIIEDIKRNINLVEWIQGDGVTLNQKGRYWVGLCPFHTEKSGSFYVYADGGFFKCYGCGATGDIFTWVGYKKHRVMELRGQQFVEVAQDLAEKAGVVWPSDPKQDKRIAAQRTRERILAAFHTIAKTCWTPTAYCQAEQRKRYLTKGFIDKYELGYSPTLSECLKAGLTEKELLFVGLLRDSKDTTKKPYMFFRKRLLIPFWERGRLIYFVGRTLTDQDDVSLQELNKQKKYLTMPSKSGRGCPYPVGYNIDSIYTKEADEKGVWLVEGCLDALYLHDRGQPAIAFLKSVPDQRLIDRLTQHARSKGALV